jgi:NADH-quinone oxidoreductase subunit C
MADLKTLADKYGTEVVGEGHQAYVYVGNDKIVEALELLKKQKYEILLDATCVDELGQATESRFTIVYHLMHSSNWDILRIKSRVAKNDVHPTVTHLFPPAGFAEREVYDMYGVDFEGHPDMRRILCPDDFEGFPLRKDFPLRGKGYREDFPNYTRDLLQE